MDIGRGLWHEREEMPEKPQLPSASVREEVCRFEASTRPWRIRMEWESPPGSPAAGETLIVNESYWWLISEGRVLTNEGRPEFEPETMDLPILLRPVSLVAGFRFKEEAPAGHPAGRQGVGVAAEPREDLGWAAPGLVVLGSDMHQLIVDARLGIVLRWEAFVLGRAARGRELLDVSQSPLDNDTFDIPSGLPVVSVASDR